MTELTQEIKNIIDRSRMHDESFLTDSQKAAQEIVELLMAREQLLQAA